MARSSGRVGAVVIAVSALAAPACSKPEPAGGQDERVAQAQSAVTAFQDDLLLGRSAP